MIQLPTDVLKFMDSFKSAGHDIFLVGGGVRHLLMGEPVVNWDFTTSALPEQILQLHPHSFYHNQFGTVGSPVEINGQQLIFETTTFRKETTYTNARHPDKIEWAQTLEEDLARRDFTINAMAYGYRKGNDELEFVDAYGGKKDISSKIIRAVGDPDTRFKEDALRLMRAIRQSAQLGFMIEPRTLDALHRNSTQITKISWERIRDEFLKILTAHFPGEGIRFLHASSLLKYILPEVDACFNVQQKSPKRHHMYDVGTHLVESLKACPSHDPITRFATFIHDIGKVQTYRKDPETQIITFYNHEVVGAQQAAHIADRFRLSSKEKSQLVTLVSHHQFSVTEEQSDKAIRRFIRDVGLELVDEMLALRTADRIGSGAKETSWRTELFKKRIVEVQKIPFSVKNLHLNGNDIMEALHLQPGPAIGKILNLVFEKVENGEIPNEHEALMKAAQEIYTTIS